jgi:putative hydrolase of the HAD superfamily
MSEKKFLDDIEVVSFDAGFTLIYTDPPVGEVYAGVAARFGYSFDSRDIHTRFLKTWTRQNALNRERRADNAMADEERSYFWWKEIFNQSIGDIMDQRDLERMFDVCYEEYARGKYWRLFPDVEPVLQALRSRGYRLVVLSNWDHRLNQTLKEVCLDHFFEKIYISTLIGHAKPDPGAFHYAADDLKVQAQSVLHVGDTWEEDILGAREAGINAVCIDRKKRYLSKQDETSIISNLSELLK